MSAPTSSVIDQAWQIERYRICALRAALRLEIAGMKGRGRSAYSQLRAIFGGRTRTEALERVNAWISNTAPVRRDA